MKYKCIFLIIVSCCLIIGCENKQEQDNEVIIDDPNTISPCFNQSWDCGQWAPTQEDISAIRLYRWYVGEQIFGSQICETCFCTRIINVKTNQERLFPDAYQQAGCSKHTWAPGISGTITETKEIKNGDIIVVYFNKKVYFLWIDCIDASNEQLDYKYSVLSQRAYSKNTSQIQWSRLSWQKRKHEKSFLCSKDLEIFFETYPNSSFQDVLGVYYCYKYGGRVDYDTPNPYYIAIIPKEDIEKEIIDLSKYRFKTWQDGMGNKCEEK